MDKSWMPTTGGILNLICGAVDIFAGIVMIIIGAASGWFLSAMGTQIPPAIPMVLFTVFGILVIIIGVIALLGGIYALRRKIWGMALAGAIISIFIIWPLGVASTVFIALSRSEFS